MLPDQFKPWPNIIHFVVEQRWTEHLPLYTPLFTLYFLLSTNNMHNIVNEHTKGGLLTQYGFACYICEKKQ